MYSTIGLLIAFAVAATLGIFQYGESQRYKANLESLQSSHSALQAGVRHAAEVSAQTQLKKAATLDSVRPALQKVRRFHNAQAQARGVSEVQAVGAGGNCPPDSAEFRGVFNAAIEASNAATGSVSGSVSSRP